MNSSPIMPSQKPQYGDLIQSCKKNKKKAAEGNQRLAIVCKWIVITLGSLSHQDKAVHQGLPSNSSKWGRFCRPVLLIWRKALQEWSGATKCCGGQSKTGYSMHMDCYNTRKSAASGQGSPPRASIQQTRVRAILMASASDLEKGFTRVKRGHKMLQRAIKDRP